MIWGIMVPANALFAVPDAATQAADRAGRRGGLRGYCRGSRAGLKYRAVLGMPHGAGLRASEVFSLKVSDIDGDRMLIHVDAGKGGKDRRVMLSSDLLDLLRDLWREAQHAGDSVRYSVQPGFGPCFLTKARTMTISKEGPDERLKGCERPEDLHGNDGPHGQEQGRLCGLGCLTGRRSRGSGAYELLTTKARRSGFRR